MTGATPFASDNQRGLFHHRFPIGRGHLGDQDIALVKDQFLPSQLVAFLSSGKRVPKRAFHANHFFVVLVDANSARADSLTYCLSFGENLAVLTKRF